MKIVILGLSITSSWGNGHATTFRGLVRELSKRGHDVLFLERNVPWYAAHRDLPRPPYGRTELYDSLADLRRNFAREVAEADCTVIGSYVPDGIEVCRWALRASGGLMGFYDIDTPVTLARLERDDCEYLARDLIPQFDFYLSFTGGPTLDLLELEYGARSARPLYCAVDPAIYYPQRRAKKWVLGYLGTYSPDRQPALQRLLLTPACMLAQSHFVVAGPQYPAGVVWPPNVARIENLAPADHRGFYNSQRFTLNLTRADMRAAGYSPSVRLFEAAACGTPIISDHWNGLEEFFTPGREIYLADNAAEVVDLLRGLSDDEIARLGARARERVLAEHTAAHRAAEFEAAVEEARPLSVGVSPRPKTSRRRLAAKT
jgi:spore maturation protein CgeB